MYNASTRSSKKSKKLELSPEELSLIDEFLDKNGQAIKGQIETLLKVYSEQIILVHLYARDISYHNEPIHQRLMLIDFIDSDYDLTDKEDIDTDLKVQLIKALDHGYDFFSVISKIDEKNEYIGNKIKDFATRNNIIFDAVATHSLAYSCSQLSAALIHAQEMLPRLASWLDKYLYADPIREEMETVIRKRKWPSLRRTPEQWELNAQELENIGSQVVTRCHEQIEDVYNQINKYIPTHNYSIKVATAKETCKFLEDNFQSLSKYDPGYSHQSHTHLIFDSRLLYEGSKDELMRQIENTLFGPKTHTDSRRREPQKLLIPSDIKALAKWHKSTNLLVKRFDQIPRCIASVIEHDLANQPKNTFTNADEWYLHVTEKITEYFGESATMAMWCEYEKKRTHERFKKRLQYLKFGMSSYKSIRDLVGSTIAKSKDYPLQSTTYPPLWRPKAFYTNLSIK